MNEKYVISNPHSKDHDELPTIYGFNAGPIDGYEAPTFQGYIISEDGKILGQHTCSNESFMLGDLAMRGKIGWQAERHEEFEKHYPDGYKTEFVTHSDIYIHPGLRAAIRAYFDAGGEPLDHYKPPLDLKLDDLYKSVYEKNSYHLDGELTTEQFVQCISQAVQCGDFVRVSQHGFVEPGQLRTQVVYRPYSEANRLKRVSRSIEDTLFAVQKLLRDGNNEGAMQLIYYYETKGENRHEYEELMLAAGYGQ